MNVSLDIRMLPLAVLYALAEMQMGPRARELTYGHNARLGLHLVRR